MGLFDRKPSGAGHSVSRTGDCLYRGEPFPHAGEQIQISVFEVEFLYSQGQFPDTWTAAVRAIRERTGEPDEPRVYVNILGTLLAMSANSFRKLGKIPELQANAIQAESLLHKGVDEVARYRELFAVAPDFGAAFDFEITKNASLLASTFDQRAKNGWPYPDIWKGDLSPFQM